MRSSTKRLPRGEHLFIYYCVGYEGNGYLHYPIFVYIYNIELGFFFGRNYLRDYIILIFWFVDLVNFIFNEIYIEASLLSFVVLVKKNNNWLT